MKQYLDLCRATLQAGKMRETGKSDPSMGIFGGGEFVHDMADGFPLLTTKQMNFRSIEAEFVGFILGVTNAKDFEQLGTKIWNADASKEQWLRNPYRDGEGDLGPMYGRQWRKYEHLKIVEVNYLDEPSLVRTMIADGYEIVTEFTKGLSRCYVMRKEIDQLQRLIDGIKANPFGRRHVVSAWNPGEVDKVALPACHTMFQCYVHDGYLDLKMYQRAADVLLGIPYNMASYAMMLMLVAELTGYKPGKLIISFGDIHIYKHHLPQVWTQLSRAPMSLPEVTLRKINCLDEAAVGMFQCHGYESHPALKARMST